MKIVKQEILIKQVRITKGLYRKAGSRSPSLAPVSFASTFRQAIAT